jgi:hypothetical protein
MIYHTEGEHTTQLSVLIQYKVDSHYESPTKCVDTVQSGQSL